MQRVLSYQTAVRVNADEMDSRDYVSRRTCVSLVLSVAFFTMICGFLLGKFVSDRHHHIRQLTLEQNRLASQNSIKTALALPATRFVENSSSVHHEDQNRRLWLEFYACIENQNKVDYTLRLDAFVATFVDRQFQSLNKCLQQLDLTIENAIKAN